MIKHVVILTLKENSPFEEIKEKILELKNFIPEIIDIDVGIDIRFDKNPSDIAIITILKDKKDLEIYANHPKHLEVIKNYIKPYLKERRVVDYEKI